VADEQSWKAKYGPFLAKAAALIVAAVAGALAHWLGVDPKMIEKLVPVPAPAESPGAFTPTFGWVKDEIAIRENADPAKVTQFAGTPAGKAALGDDDVFLWRTVRKVNPKKPEIWYPNINQQSVGCCVGCGWKHSADVCLAVQVASGKAEEWKPVSAEVIYGGSRVEVGGGRISGDGSVGQWAARWCQQVGGLVPMEKFDEADLSTFSPQRARTFGRSGVPKAIEDASKLHPVKGCALVTSWADVKRAVGQGYPVAVCSDQGFRMERDATGRARPQGTWAHCMCIIGVRNGANEGGFILNSWGDQAHTGPVWPPDAPVAGFWADAATIDRMVRQGDSFALADAVGFPARKPPDDWFIRAVPAAPQNQMVVFQKAHRIPFTTRSLITTEFITAEEAARRFRIHSEEHAW